MQPPCEDFVPGYGATTADFHVIGDHPTIHGGRSSGIPFMDEEWSSQFFEILAAGGVVAGADTVAGELDSPNAFFSYIHQCVPTGRVPDEHSYTRLEPFFDAELRAITAHVLLPVGSRATARVLESYTAIDQTTAADMDAIHATELRGSGWLVLPIKDPAEWTDEDVETLAAALQHLQESEYEQISDLGRFQTGGDPYFVR